MRKVTVYDTELCLDCWSVQKIFEKREIPYEHVVVPEGSEAHEQLTQRTGMQTLPQVFIGSLLIGGYEEIAVAVEAGMLADLLVD
jgi:glutaredoxin 3